MKIWLQLFSFLLFSCLSSAQASPTEAEMIKLYEVETPRYYVRSAIDVEWSPDGRLFAVRFDYPRQYEPTDILWRVYNTATGEILHSFKSTRPYLRNSLTGEERYFALTFEGHADNTVILTLDVQNSLRIYNADHGQLKFSLENVVSFPLYAPDGEQFLVDTNSDEVLRVYDTNDFALIYQLDGFRVWGDFDQIWSPDSSAIVVVSEGFDLSQPGPFPYILWKTRQHVLIPLEQRTWTVLWSENSTQVATGTGNNEIEIYDADNGILIETVTGYSEKPTLPLYLNEHYLLTLSGDYLETPIRTLSLWDFEKERLIEFDLIDLVYDFTIDDNNLTLIEPSIQIRYINLLDEFDVQTTDFGKLSPIRYFSPDRHWIITLAISWQDYMARLALFSAEPYEQKDSLTQPYTTYVSWSPDNQHFATVDENYNVSIWQMVGE